MNIDLDRRAFVQTGGERDAGATVGSPAAAQTAGPVGPGPAVCPAAGDRSVAPAASATPVCTNARLSRSMFIGLLQFFV